MLPLESVVNYNWSPVFLSLYLFTFWQMGSKFVKLAISSSCLDVQTTITGCVIIILVFHLINPHSFDQSTNSTNCVSQ